MVVTEALLVLLGTISSFSTANPLNPTEIIIEKHINPELSEKLTHFGLPAYPPFISNFMQHGTNVFFKPQIMLSPSYVPGQGIIFDSKEDCKKWPAMVPAIPFAAPPEIVLDEPVKITETVVSDAAPPTIDKVVVIKPASPIKPELFVPPMLIAPLSAITEELAVEVPVSTPIVLPDIPDLPPLPFIPKAMDDVFQPSVTEQVIPAFIPEVPQLPPLSIPEVLVPSSPTGPVLKPVSSVEEYDNVMSVNIPEAPELPPFIPPKLPATVIIPEVTIECVKQNKTKYTGETPILIESQPLVTVDIQPIIKPLPPVLPSPVEMIVSQSVLEEKPTDIPPIPVLPEFHETMLMNVPVPEIVVSHQDEFKPIFTYSIPNPPELPPMPVPDLPMNVVIPEPISTVQEQLKIPTPPVLSPMAPVSFPISTVIPELIEAAPEMDLLNKPQPMEIASQPVLSPITPVLLPVSTVVSELIPELSPTDEPKPVLIEESKFKPIEIPAPPVLPPIAPVSLAISTFISEPQPILIEEPKFKPVVIPAPPILSPMSPVSLPISTVVAESIVAAPELPPSDESKLVLIEEPKFKPVVIPAPPVLSPIAPDSLPVSVVVPEYIAATPELPEILSNEIPFVEVSEFVKPIPIPEAPLVPIEAVTEEINVANEPLNIPTAPELPPLPFPSMSNLFEKYPPAELIPMLVEEPKLPQITESKRPLFMTFAEPSKLPMSKVESIISFPTSCVKNIVIERILPNIVKQEKVEVFSSSNYPVLSSYSPTIGIRLF